MTALLPFCGPPTHRYPGIATPWECGLFAYATDARIVARVPGLRSQVFRFGPNPGLLFEAGELCGAVRPLNLPTPVRKVRKS